MPVDRDAALKRAEKLLRQGKLEGAIAEYVRLVEDQPRDWNAINALGDLYVRAGDPDRAVAQFTRVADFLYAEGFLPKAAALYKKALKTRSDHEPTLLQLGEIAARQRLLADAKTYFRQLAHLRRARDDQRGAAEALVRLGSVEEADAESKIEGARAAVQLGDTVLAARLLTEAAEAFQKQQRNAEALNAFVEAAQLDPDDTLLRARVARECVGAGDFDRARPFLTPDSAGDDPDLLLAIVRIQLAEAGGDARPALMRLLTVSPARHDAVLALCEEVAAGDVEGTYRLVDVLTDVALLEGNFDRAITTLQTFLSRVTHVPALVKLVEVSVDAGRNEPMRQAQAALVDAYLETGYTAEARVIAEDLLAGDPQSEAHRQRLRRALRLLGVEDIDAAVARVVPADELELPWASDRSSPVASRLSREDDGSTPGDARSTYEVDLNEVLSGIEPAAPAMLRETLPQDLEAVFEQMRTRAAGQHEVAGAANLYDRGLEHASEGRIAEAVADLQAAARAPLYRFAAAAALGRVHVGRGELASAVEWFERAAEAPAPTPEEGFALLYELADTLDCLGESARALAVLMELDADTGGYRDVRERVAQLARDQAGSRGT